MTAWLEFFCVYGPGDVQGMPVRLPTEFVGFVVDCYALAWNGRLMYDSAFFSRPKGCDKSGLAGYLALGEALGPCRFAGFAEGGEVYTDPWGLGFRYVYRPGEPMGKPVHVPYVRIMATEEGQTGNVYDVVYYNLSHEGTKLSQVPGVIAGLTKTRLPGGGDIQPSTASSSAKDGGKETFVVFDETHLYNKPELRQMYKTVTRNMVKRKRGAGTWFLETTTMYKPGEDSVAEETYKAARAIEEGKTRAAKIMYDHRWGECENLEADDELIAAVEDAFGDAMAWNDLEGILDQVRDLRSDPSDTRRYFLNAETSSADAWILAHVWNARLKEDDPPADRDIITIGFDGSRKRARGVTDATALIGCRLRDGLVFEIGVWEAPPNNKNPDGTPWEVPRDLVEVALKGAFQRFKVVAFYADPARWETAVAEWEAKYGPRLKVKGTRGHPIEYWMTGEPKRTVAALKAFKDAIIDGEMWHQGEPSLTKHVLHARKRTSTQGTQIAKSNPDSPDKIDAAVAATLAWAAALDAVAAGANRVNTPTVPTNLRAGSRSRQTAGI